MNFSHYFTLSIRERLKFSAQVNAVAAFFPFHEFSSELSFFIQEKKSFSIKTKAIHLLFSSSSTAERCVMDFLADIFAQTHTHLLNLLLSLLTRVVLCMQKQLAQETHI